MGDYTDIEIIEAHHRHKVERRQAPHWQWERRSPTPLIKTERLRGLQS